MNFIDLAPPLFRWNLIERAPPLFMHHSIGSYQEPPNHTYKKDTTALEEKLLLKDYCSIISNSELFLALFYKACASLEHAHDNQCFRVSQAGRTIKIFGKEHNKKDFEKGVEQIRALFEKNYRQNKQCTIVPIKVTGDIYFRAPSPEEIDLKNWLDASSGRIMGHIYDDHILPSMPVVAKSIGAIYSDTVVEQRWKDTSSNTKKIKSFNIKFLGSDHYIYPIPPVQISNRESMVQSMYALYKAKDQPLCTLTLRPGTGKEIKMHSLPLYLYGGEMMQKMLTNGFSEATTATIVMPDFSEEVVREFVEFSYLGPDALKPEEFFKRGVNVCDLLRMAHLYQIPQLIDCCTNLLSLGADTDQADDIKLLADTFNNEHLQQLYTHLIKAKKVIEASVDTVPTQLEPVTAREYADVD